MLTFITGQPGAGKTLFLISKVDALAKKTGRPVFYNKKQKPDDPESPGQLEIIDFEMLPWHPIDDGVGMDWFNCPEGAIIVLDECHRELFPMRQVGSTVPDHVDAMSTHRHRGHDVFITAQHSTQVDTFIRKMAGEHHHFIRRFGSRNATRFTWMEHKDEKNPFERKAAQQGIFRYPTKYFGAYKSTVLDTVEKKLPVVRIGFMLLAALAVPFLLMFAVSAIWPDDEKVASDLQQQKNSGEFPTIYRVIEDKFIEDRPILYDSETWQREVPDIPFSAKLFDASVKVVSYPRVSGCSRITTTSGSDSCDCYSQQGTNLRISYKACVDYMRYGWFDFSKPDVEDSVQESKKDSDPVPITPMPASPASAARGAAGGAATGLVGFK